MGDPELDSYIQKELKLDDSKPLDEDFLFSIVCFYFPGATFSSDGEVVKRTGCAYFQFTPEDKEEDLYLISDPTINKVRQALYIIVLSILTARRAGKNEITLPRLI
jgi:hypothetical protein